MPPTGTNGKVCYIEIPALNVRRSAEFYSRVFGWKARERGDGSLAFDDATGQVSGAWVLGRPASAEPGGRRTSSTRGRSCARKGARASICQ